MCKQPVDFFSKEMALKYDERNSKLFKISEGLHFLITLALKDLPIDAKVLCVGAGTGAEILSLAKVYPHWKFVALEPSLSMLEVCRERLQEAGVADRCEFVHGYVQDLDSTLKFDAVLSILVAHFVKLDERLDFFKNMASLIKKNGYLVNAEISFDLESKEFPSMLKNWEAVQTLMGATPESIASLPTQLKKMLTILPTSQTEDLIRQSGLSLPVRFFQAFMISAWYAVRT